jgi:pimeloyl-ACP methyl ester carboxylesterase
MVAPLPRLILVPGLGVGPDLYLPQRPLPARVEVPTWLSPFSGETLEQYGQRMASRVKPDGDLYIGGVSYGGLVALEMAKHLPVRGVFLIASMRSPAEIPWYYRPGILAAQATPRAVLRGLLWASPLFVRIAGRFNRRDRALAVRVIRGMDVDVARWSLRSMLAWKGEPPDVPIHQVQGTDDWILPPSYVRRATFIRGGGHLMNIHCAAEVNRFIAARLTPAASAAWRPAATPASST